MLPSLSKNNKLIRFDSIRFDPLPNAVVCIAICKKQL